MSKIKLQPCPFCASEVSIYEPEIFINGYYYAQGYCIRCFACKLLFGYDESYKDGFKTPEEAADAWNRRV